MNHTESTSKEREWHISKRFMKFNFENKQNLDWSWRRTFDLCSYREFLGLVKIIVVK